MGKTKVLLPLAALLLAACGNLSLPGLQPKPFTLALNPASLSIAQGSSDTTTLTVTPQNGFTGTVSLSLVGAPSGITLTPTGVTVSGSGPVTQALTVSVDKSVAPGTYALKVRGTAGSYAQEANLTLSVTPTPFTLALDLSSPLQIVAPGGQVQVPVRATFNDSRVASLTLTVRLADPCAKGTSNCPGWDASRYPGVAHPTGSFALTPASPTATLTFRVDPGALSQGPSSTSSSSRGRTPRGRRWRRWCPSTSRSSDPGNAREWTPGTSGGTTWAFPG